MFIEVISPDKVIFSGEAISVRLPGKDGYFEILNDHAAIIALLKQGEIRITKPNGEKETILSKKGFVEVNNNKITVLV